jgi:hypothetical protein
MTILSLAFEGNIKPILEGHIQSVRIILGAMKVCPFP